MYICVYAYVRIILQIKKFCKLDTFYEIKIYERFVCTTQFAYFTKLKLLYYWYFSTECFPIHNTSIYIYRTYITPY